ncbi:cytochrome P450 [Actinomycetospora sp. CA-084318]|uniref:cytochrome P450 n=1 Tax=Actinomycetospora sp. CA-084318 TaxID=3239892 RepID=UPI003D962C4B
MLCPTLAVRASAWLIVTGSSRRERAAGHRLRDRAATCRGPVHVRDTYRLDGQASASSLDTGVSMTSRECPVVHFDTTDQALRFEDVQLFDEIRDAGGIAWTEDNGGLWAVSDFALCKAIASDAKRFISGEGVRFPARGGPKVFALEYDRPRHTVHRRALSEAVSAATVPKLEPMVRGHARSLLQRARSEGRLDLSEDLAFPLPLDVIFSLVGAPDDLKQEVDVLTEALLLYRKPADDGGGDEITRLINVFDRLIALKVEQPGDDWLSGIVQTYQGSGGELDMTEIQGAIFAILFGGHHSTARGIACLLARIVTDPDLQRSLRADPELIARATEESLRIATPLRWFARTAVEDVEIGGQLIRAGQHVYLLYGGANLDPKRYDDPADFRLDRPRSFDHLAFGWGIHRCAGMPLAQLEIRVAVEELFACGPWLELDGEISWTALVEPRSIPCRFAAAPTT